MSIRSDKPYITPNLPIQPAQSTPKAEPVESSHEVAKPAAQVEERNKVREGLNAQSPILKENEVNFGQQLKGRETMNRAIDIVERLSSDISADERTELSMELAGIIQGDELNDSQLLDIGTSVVKYLKESDGVDQSLNAILGNILDKVDQSAPDNRLVNLNAHMASMAAEELAVMLKNGASPAEIIAKVNQFTSRLEGLNQQELTGIARDLGQLMVKGDKNIDEGLAPLLTDVLKRAADAPEAEGFNFTFPTQPQMPFEDFPPEILERIKQKIQNEVPSDPIKEILEQQMEQFQLQIDTLSPEQVQNARIHLEEAQQLLEEHAQSVQNIMRQVENP